MKYYEKSFERLTQANGEKLIINYKIPNVHICNDGICFETVFVLIKNLSSKVILGNPFMPVLYPFLTIDEGIKTNVLGKNLLFKEIYSLNNTSIIKEIDKERINRKNRHLLSLKTKISLDDQLTNSDIKKFKEDIEIGICSNLLIAFWHRNRHITQSPCEKGFNGKDTKDRTMLTISFN